MTGQTETANVSRPLTVSVSAGKSPDGVATDKVADEVIPSIGAYRNDKHEYWFNAEGPKPSVTTVLQIVDKPAVGIHKAKEAARAVFRALIEAEPAMGPAPNLIDPEEAMIKWALKEADKARDTAAEMGSSVHLLADLLGAQESGSKGFEISESEIPYVRAYEDFLARYGRSSIVSSEHMVWSLDGYAGTYDQLMMLPCDYHLARPGEHCSELELWLIDIKTSAKGPYPEWALQLAAYAWAHWIIVPGQSAPHQMPAVMRFGVLHLRPDLYTDTGWRLIEYPVTERDYRAFLSALDLWTWRKEGRFTKSQLNKP